MPEDEIVTQGDEGHNLYFIAKGDCDVYVIDHHKNLSFVQEIGMGEFFGEVALVKECRRTATVKSKNYSTLAALNHSNFLELRSKYPEIMHKFNKKIRSYKDKWKKFQIRSLMNIDFLNHDISPFILESLSYKLSPMVIGYNEYLVKAGDQANDIFIVVSGELDISIKNQETDRNTVIDTIYSGCTIGAYSILNADPHSISIKARYDCTILALNEEDLEKV